MAPPTPVQRLIECLGRLPGIGPKTSERLAYHMLRAGENQAGELAAAIQDAVRSTRVCSQCANLDQTDPCRICADPERDTSMLLVVENARDVLAFEESGYHGLYHVLGGRISSLEGIPPEDLTVAALLQRAEGRREVCLATNPDLEGEGTARLLAGRLAGTGVRVTRLARGIPAGATITQVSGSILTDAIEGRRPV